MMSTFLVSWNLLPKVLSVISDRSFWRSRGANVGANGGVFFGFLAIFWGFLVERKVDQLTDCSLDNFVANEPTLTSHRQHIFCEKCDHRANRLFPPPCWRCIGKSGKLSCQSSSTQTRSDSPLQHRLCCSLGSPYYKFGGFKSSNNQIKIGTILVTKPGANFLFPISTFNSNFFYLLKHFKGLPCLMTV